MKKILCVTLSLLLMFNTTVVYADIHGGSSGSFDVTPTPAYPIPADMLDENGRLKPPKLLDFLDKGVITAMIPEKRKETVATLIGFLDSYDNSDNSISIENGGSTVHFHDTFTNKFNTAIQDKVHALDGYWLFEPTNSDKHAVIPKVKSSFLSIYSSNANKLTYINSDTFDTDFANYIDYMSCVVFYPLYYNDTIVSGHPYFIPKSYSGFDTRYYMYLVGGSLCVYDKEKNYTSAQDLRRIELESNLSFNAYSTSISSGFYTYLNGSMPYAFGSPFRVFYSFEDLSNFLNKGRIYIPKLPSGGFKVNIKYINNTTNLPDITYNITTENKTELEIQNQYDTTINNYLDSLDDFSSGSDDKPVTPTPTPIISDGQPTPTPGFTDGSLTPTPPPTNVDLTDTNNWLEKIYKWLESFGKSHDKFTKDLSDYLETHKGKLEDIIKALDKIADGMEKGEDDGCKYDYSELSDFMKELWNESDKKFDTMIDLLETNNEYQKKLVKSLNEIKAILVTQTVLELFQNRSEETANEAKEKFPTSIPWDIAMVLNAMSADPKPLKAELPIKIESFKINESITVDLTGKEWEQLATTCRYLLSITFILYLIHLSRKLFSKGDDD